MLQAEMTKNEIGLLESYLAKSTKYIEFGCGGSSYLAAKHKNLQEIHSIESSEEWVETVKQDELVAQAIQDKRLYLHYVDIGPVAGWGMPTDIHSIELWPNYYWTIWQQLPKDVDCILIDGRFRIACALSLLLLELNPDLHILIHDFSSRVQYHLIRDFFTEKEAVDDLSVFTFPQKRNSKQLARMLKQYRFCPGDALPGFCIHCPRSCKQIF